MADRWGTAQWGYDRWPALSVADLIQQPPALDRGALIGVGDWRLVVEVMLPADVLGTWGLAKWGEQEWNVLAWQDITPYVRGMEWTRGADEYLGRPRVGSASITLDNAGQRWSPWNPSPPQGSAAYFAPGTIIRAGVRSAVDSRASGWIPQFCVIADEWGESYEGVGTDTWIDVSGFETLRDLASIESNGLPGVVGAGEVAKDRFARLIEASNWPYGLLIDAPNVVGGGYSLKSTDMSMKRIDEFYLTADSCDARFRSSRKGEAMVENIEYGYDQDPAVWPLVDFSKDAQNRPFLGFLWYSMTSIDGLFVPYDADSFKSVTSDAHIVNDARYARVGQPLQVYEQPASIERHGRRTEVRTDFICDSDAQVAVFAKYATIRKGLNTLRVPSVTIATSDRGDDVYLATIAADIGVKSTAYPLSYDPASSAPQPFVKGALESMTHSVTPRSNGSVTWSSTFGVATRTVNNLPAAQLPFNPL